LTDVSSSLLFLAQIFFADLLRLAQVARLPLIMFLVPLMQDATWSCDPSSTRVHYFGDKFAMLPVSEIASR